MRGIQGTTAILTGAGSGIGHAMDFRLASEDAALITSQTISVSGGLTMHG